VTGPAPRTVDPRTVDLRTTGAAPRQR